MSFQINSDKEFIKGGKPAFIGENEFTIRSGAGADEREVLRTQLDGATNLPRVGINRTGERINNIDVVTGGTGYTTPPSVTVGPPQLVGGTQALASAFIFNGRVVSIAVNDPGSGYSSAPQVTITGGNGSGAEGTAVLDTVDFELDINGAIRTSTSIISDTARILNLDIDNFVTPDANFRGPNLKTYANNTGTPWSANVILQKDSYRYFGNNMYQALNSGQTGDTAPEHKDGVVLNGEVNFKHIGFRVEDPNAFRYNDTGDSGVFPRSITPLLGDRSDKIATTEYVLNLATNDVGGRIYVSSQIGSDLNDGRSAVNPVRTIKKAAQLAWATPGVKETLIVSGGDYVEDNPISLPPDASVVGDNLRLVIIRPNNPGKHIFKFGDKNYVTGVTYRDKIDSNGDAVSTWDFAMVFDDKQQIQVDYDANGDFGTTFPIGHQIFGPEQFRVTFQQNTGLQQLVSGLTVVGVNTGARANIVDVVFAETTGASAYIGGTIDVRLSSGSFVAGEQFRYITSASRGSDIGGDVGNGASQVTGSTDANTIRAYQSPLTEIPPGTKVEIGTTGGVSIGFYEVASINSDNSPTYWDVVLVPILNSPEIPENGSGTSYTIYSSSVTEFTFDSTDLKSIRAEGEVVSVDEDITTTVPIVRIDFSQQGQAAITTGGFQNAQFGNSEDLGGIVFYTNELVGRQNTHNFKEGQEIEISGLSTVSPDLSFLMGKQRIYKVIEDADGRSRRFVIPKKAPSLTNANYDPGQFAVAKSYTKTVTLSLLNSPNKFPISSPVDRRYQDAVTFIRNNRDFIADEVVGKVNAEFAKYYYSVYDLDSTAKTFKVYLGASSFEHTYVSGGTVTYGGNSYNITNFVYDNTVTGEATITTSVAIPALEDETVRLDNILVECSNGQKLYPSFSIPVDDDQCRQDIVHFLNALCRDLEFGSNHNIIEAGEKYIVGAKIGLVDNEIIQTVRAMEYARELAVFAMCNWRTGTRIPTEPIYTPVYSSITRYFDDSVITSTAPDPQTGVACANVESAINTLTYLFIDVVANNTSGTYLDAAYLIARNKDLIADQAYKDAIAAYPSLGLNNIDERKCRRDIGYILKGLTRDLALGGNAGILTQAEAYYSGAALTGIPAGEIGATRYAFSQVARYATAAMRNWTTGNYIDLTPTTATYDPANGTVTVTFPTPTQGAPTTNDRIAFTEGALTFSCTDNGGGSHASPERFDSNFGKDYAITNVNTSGGSTTVTCTVPTGGTAQSAHSFVSAKTDGTIIIYDTVDTTSDIPKFVDWNILVDPGSAPLQLITPTDATYNPANGDFTITTATAHGLSTNEALRLAPESFVFTCAMDSNRSEHYLPAVGQPAYGNTLAITGTTTNTITVNVGASAADQQFTPTNASYDPATGLLDITIGTHNLGVGEGIVLSDGALSFTCAMDNFDAVKSYPRSGIDPYSGRSMPIVSRTDTTITLNVGKSGPNKYFTPSAANYNPTTGDMTVTVGQHGLGVGRGVVLEDNSFTFTCALDGNQSQHTYPRPGTDPYAGKSIAITAVGSTSHTITDADYDPALGEITFTLAGHGWSNGDYIKIDDGALTFTCTLDNNVTQHTYPRNYEYASGRWFAISDVTTDTFKITGLPIPRDTSTHTFVSAAAGSVKRQDGTFTINVGTSSDTSAHTFVSATANAIKHEPQSTHVYQGSLANSVKHLPQSAHTFKRTDDNSVAAYASIGGAPACANVAATIDTEMDLLDSILQYATDPTNGTEPGSTTYNYGTLFDTTEIRTYPDSFAYDQNNQRVAIRGDFDDYPIIEASPYTQNASVISFLGGGGALIDGSKVKQPNCPFPGLELDGTASFPNQGKSMVAAAFTIVSFGGTGYKVINDGYTQLVSVFVIFCADGVFCESGGYASITNSATNFGQFALRANGYREECYSFDQATITNVSSTPTGRTILTVSGLGREPLEHYIAKIDGYRNTNEDIEYFIDAITGVTVGPPFAAQLTFDNGTGDPMDLTDISTGQAVSTSALQGATIKLHRPSIVNSSSHTWEFAGSGTNYLALPENGGTKVEANEQVSELYGRVYVSGTDELGDFKVGTFAKIENRTGAITFTGTVTISEVEFLKLKGGDVVVTGFDASNTLGGANSSDSKIPTQKAVKDFITNNLGPYINKPYSTNAVPRALVELTDSGKISLDQIPALRPFQVFTVADQAERLAIEGALAGDIAIQQDIQSSFILNNDLDSLFLGFAPDPTIQFTLNDIFTGSVSGGRIQATEYRTGVVYQINITDGGSGYTQPPTVSFSGGSPGLGAVAAAAECTIANGEVVTVTIIAFNGYKGGLGYTSAPTVTFSAPAGSGTQATGNCLIESRLYGDIVNNIAIEDTDTIDSSDVPAVTVNINRVVNTSADNSNNWVSLSSNQIAATDITSGTINTDRLANSGAANSFTFLRGDSAFALAVQSIKGSETRYFAQLYSSASSGSSQLVFTTNSDVLVGHEVQPTVVGIQANTNITGVTTVGGLTTISLNNPLTSTIPTGTIIEFERGESPMIFESSFTQGNFVDDVIISVGGSGFTNGQYFDVGLTGGSGTGLKANIIVAGNQVTDVTVTDGGSGYSADFTITVAPGVIGGGSGLVLEAKVSTVNRQYANVSLDVQRASDLTISADDYGTIGVARYKKSQFNIGQEGNGSIELKTGADSGLDADLLDGVQGAFYLNSSNQNSGTLPSDRLAGSYNINIVGSSTNTLRLITGTNNPVSSPTPNNFVDGIVSNTINNQADGLFDGGTRHLVMTLRNGGVDFDATYGGARQLAFTDNDNMWLRGSGTAVTTWGTWQKVWTSLNDGEFSGLDADRLDGNQGGWYQNALNMRYGTLSERRLPRFIEGTGFRDSLSVKSYNGDLVLTVYISGAILNTTPFTPSSTVKFYDDQSQAAGDFVLNNIIINDDTSDNTEDYTILVGRLISGNLTTVAGAVQIGTASNRVNFDSFSLEDSNTSTIAELESDSGTAKLNLGRKDGVASSPGIFFNSSVLAANFNVAMVATGGTGTDGSGALNVQVANADAMTILGQKIWNEGNVQFNSANIASTAVIRDASGNFSASTITASLTGAASLNVLKAGDSMTGTLNITGAGSNLNVSGNAAVTGTTTLTNDLAVDSDTLFVDVSADKVGINAGTEPDYQLELRGDDGIAIYSITNQGNGALGSDDATGGARLTFSDHAGGSFGQKGFFVYKHGDGSVSGTSFNNYFIMDSTEASLMFKVGSTSSPGTLSVTNRLGIQTDTPSYPLDVAGEARVRGHLYLDNGADNSGAQIQFLGASTRRNFRIGNQEGHDRCFEITRSTSNGGNSWDSTPALLIRDDQRVAIATNQFGGNDPEDNTARTYTLNINGDVNFNGTLFQNNGEFVTSRWTEATNQLDIYRLSKVGIAQQNPTYTLQVGTYGSENGSFKVAGNSELDGTLYVGTSSTNRVYINGASLDIQGNTQSGGQVTNTLKVNGEKQYIDRYGVFKRNRATVTENVTVAASDRCMSAGPIEINNGVTVTISNGGAWAVV